MSPKILWRLLQLFLRNSIKYTLLTPFQQNTSPPQTSFRDELVTVRCCWVEQAGGEQADWEEEAKGKMRISRTELQN